MNLMFLPEDTVQLFFLKLNPCSVNKLDQRGNLKQVLPRDLRQGGVSV